MFRKFLNQRYFMSKHTFFKLLLRSIYITTAMILVWLGLNLYLNGHIWDGMMISPSALAVEYCEFNNVDKFFHQSMNTYSNLAYFFFGVLILHIAFEDYKNQGLSTQNRLERFPLLSALMGFCFIYLCFGSAFFHASLTWVGQRVDMNGTYGVTIILLGIALYHVLCKWNFSKKGENIIILALLTVILAFYKIALMISSGKLVPILILLSTLLIFINYFQFRKKRSLLLALLSIIFIIIAIKIRTLDVQKIGCDPYSVYQGHSAWHLLTAMSSFCNYAFFRFTKF